AREVLGVGASGAESPSILRRSGPLLPADESRLAALRARLLAARERRPRPARDDNIIASWNGLAIQGMCAAYQATGAASYLQAARRAADFIAGEMTLPDGGVYRAWREGKAKVPGFLDDYANLANARIDLYESGFDARDLDGAARLADLILEKFWQPGAGLFLTASDSETLVQRPRTLVDGACPSGTSASVFAFLRLAELTGGARYRERAEELLQALAPAAAHDGIAFAHLLAAREFIQRGPLEIVFAGGHRDAGPLIAVAHRIYLPARVLAFAGDVPAGEGRGPLGGRPAAYVCRYQACRAPVTTAAALAEQLAG
ncbi:MAG TPA: thioredoxin, partial [Burkholderiaceae bacterium]